MNQKFLNLFPVFGGTTAGTIEGVNVVKQNAFTLTECFSGITPAFVVNVSAAAIIGGILGFAVQRIMGNLFKKK